MEAQLMMNNHQSSINMIKKKRTKRPRSSSPLDLTMASASYSAASGLSSNSFDMDGNSTESAKSVDLEEDMANCLILLARGGESEERISSLPKLVEINSSVNPFECKTCNRCFSSFQALGGHRASHRKPKVVQILEEDKKPIIETSDQLKKISSPNNTTLSLHLSSTGRKPKVHECSICGAEFSSGQALGGHMRRHRVVPSGTNNSSTSTSTTIEADKKKQRVNLLSLDLNLPAPEDDTTCRESKFQFTSKEQVIVFSASPLIDCHY